MFCGSLLGCSGLNNLAKVTGSDKHWWYVLVQDYFYLVQLLVEINEDAHVVHHNDLRKVM